MELILILILVVLLYVRSLNYCYMPDDRVPRSGYLYDVPQTMPSGDFTSRVPPKRVRVWCIANHCANVAFINVLFGWKAALLFAVHPMCVEMVCWLTGNYYAGTTLLVLAAFWSIQTFPLFGIAAGILFYTAALNSTITALGFPIYYLLTANLPGLSLFAPFIIFLTGDRFKKGIVRRKVVVPTVIDKFNFRKLSWMTKHVGRYIFDMFLFPIRMALYRNFGEEVLRNQKTYDDYMKFNKDFWISLAICVSTFLVGILVDWKSTLWFFAMIAPHSQFRIFGQPTPCARYLYLPMIGLCVLMSHLPTEIFFMFVGFYLYRAHQYIPSWKDLEAQKKNDLDNYPERAMAYTDYGQHIMQTYVLTNKDPQRVNEASYYLQRALRMDPEEWVCHLNIALLFNVMGRLDVALEASKNALEKARRDCACDEVIEIMVRQVEELTKEECCC